MSTAISWPSIGGTPYSVPAAGEVNWQSLSNFLIALGTNAQSISNTRFSIRAATTSPVTVSSTTDCVVVTNLSVAGPVLVNLPAGVTGQVFFVADDKGDAATNNITIDPNGGELINGAATYVLNKNRAGVLFGFNGVSWTILSEFTNIAAGTVPRSSIAAGAPNQVVINDGSGNLSSESQLAKSRGGTGADNTAVTFPASGVVVTEAAAEVLTNKTIDGDNNTVQNLALTTFKTVLVDANKIVRRNSAGVVVAGPVTASDTGAMGGLISSNFAQGAAASTPATNTVVIYAKSDRKMYSKDDAGVESSLTAATVATPTNTGTITSFTPVVASSVHPVSAAGYTILDNDGYNLIEVSTGASSQTVVLPTASDNIGRLVQVKKMDSAAGTTIVDGEGSETIDGAATYVLTSQYDAVSLRCNGTSWDIVATTVKPSSQVRLYGINGQGSTNSRIRRFGTVIQNVGTAITYVDSATLGASFTIAEAGIYFVGYTASTSGSVIGISRNSAQLSTAIDAITASDVIAITQFSAGTVSTASVTMRLNVGDVIRAQDDVAAVTVAPTSTYTRFTICQVAKG